MKEIKTYLALFAAATTLFACSTGEKENTISTNHTAVPVKVMTVTASADQASVQASGKLQAVQSANLSTRMMGNVKSVKVESGQSVKKGELLLSISSADLSAKKAQVEANIVQAQTAFNNAEKDLKRFENLKAKGSASQKELENMQNRFEMMKAGLDAAESMKNEIEAQFEFLNIRAPFDGNVANVFVKTGDIAAPGHPLVSIEGLDQLEAVVMVSESDIQQLKVGQSAQLHLKSSDDYLSGTVREVSPSSKNTGGQYIVKLQVESNKPGALPGMFIQAKIVTDSATVEGASVSIPKSALVKNGQLKGVYSPSKEGKAILRWLRLGHETADQVRVLSGLKPGEKIITFAEGKLYNGATISY
ncbi:MAG: efflux RND transporter periplasmic adaptor subunit [Vicingaceae bacterium]